MSFLRIVWFGYIEKQLADTIDSDSVINVFTSLKLQKSKFKYDLIVFALHAYSFFILLCFSWLENVFEGKGHYIPLLDVLFYFN